MQLGGMFVWPFKIGVVAPTTGTWSDHPGNKLCWTTHNGIEQLLLYKRGQTNNLKSVLQYSELEKF